MGQFILRGEILVLKSTQMVLLSDMGGTNIRFALSDGQNITKAEHFKCTDFATFEDVLAQFLEMLDVKPVHFVLAVPAPVVGDDLSFVNNPWRFKISKIKQQFGFENLIVINDFMAQSLAIPHLDKSTVFQVGQGAVNSDAVSVIVGAGTGLGVGILLPEGKALPSEAGHIALSPANEQEAQILKQALLQYGRISAERFLSGPGLGFLYECMTGKTLHSEQIMQKAEACDVAARQAVFQMFSFLGDFCGDLALALCAKGGIYLSGGVLQSKKVYGLLQQSDFRKRFESKGRHKAYMEQIPTFVVTQKDVAFVGLQALAKNYFIKK